MSTTRTQMRADLLRRLGNRTDVTIADLDHWLDDALTDLTTRKIFLRSLEVVGASVTLNPGDTSFSAPSSPSCFSILHLEDTTNKRVLDRFAGEMRQYLIARQNNTSTSYPTQFIEFGNIVYVGPQAVTAVTTLVPYYYARAVWSSDASAAPGIEAEWHYGVGLVAFEHAARDLEDEARADQATQQWGAWMTKRDTSLAMRNRLNVPVGGMRPHPMMRIGRSV